MAAIAGAPPDAQIATGHAVRADWSDPDVTGRRGSYSPHVYGFRRADALLHLHRVSPARFTAALVRAGEQLRDDLEKGEGYFRQAGTGSGEQSIVTAQMAAADRYRAAVKAIGPAHCAIIDPVVLRGHTLRWWGRKFHIRHDRVSARLEAALTALHEHYNPKVGKSA